MKTENKKPFGLQIACNTAARALKEGNVPASVVLYNLFSLQKSELFPKDLDTNFFGKSNNTTNELDKRTVVKILDEIKKPNVDIVQLLESTFEKNWVKKKSALAVYEKPIRHFAPKAKKMAVKVEPVIVIKKNKLAP